MSSQAGGALRRTGYATDNGVFYVVSDHLRSTSVLVNRDGTVKSRNFYYPYGGNRGGSAFSGVTTKRFTGQYHEQGLPGGEGLSYYNARWYDAQVGAFISADTLVPSPLAPQTLNRYAYVGGNPLRYTDPTGHMPCADCDGGGGGYRTRTEPKRVWLPFISFQSPARPQPPVARSGGTSVVMQPRAPLPTLTPSVRPMAPAAYARPQWNASPKYAPDDGWILFFDVPGYFHPRIEQVTQATGTPKGTTLVGGSVEYRHVMVYDGGWQSHDEAAVSAYAGEGLTIGGEYLLGAAKVDPFVGLDFAGFEFQVQANQIMVGIVEPGVGGGRAGGEYGIPWRYVLATSQATITSAGGAEALGQRVFYNTNARLTLSQYFPSGPVQGGWLTGAQKAWAAGYWMGARVLP